MSTIANIKAHHELRRMHYSRGLTAEIIQLKKIYKVQQVDTKYIKKRICALLAFFTVFSDTSLCVPSDFFTLFYAFFILFYSMI